MVRGVCIGQQEIGYTDDSDTLITYMAAHEENLPKISNFARTTYSLFERWYRYSAHVGINDPSNANILRTYSRYLIRVGFGPFDLAFARDIGIDYCGKGSEKKRRT